MILEVAILQVTAGREADFERDFKIASRNIAAIDGYIGHSLHRCLEDASKYILHVRWTSVEAHEIGFRQSAGYQEWKKLLHHYYDPFPTVEHYRPVFSNGL